MLVPGSSNRHVQDEELDDNDDWSQEDGLSNIQKRKLCAKWQWLNWTWEELKTEHPHLLDSAFSLLILASVLQQTAAKTTLSDCDQKIQLGNMVFY
jgi:hypothetical protein